MSARSEEVHFPSADDIMLAGTMVTPEGRPRALLLFVHGITSDRSEWGIFDMAAEAFAALGVASLRFDYRGHGQSTLPSTEISLSGILGDIRSAWSVLRLAHQSTIESFVVGSSFGGGLAYRTAEVLGGFNRAFLLAPVFDYLTDITNSAAEWRAEVEKRETFSYSSLELSKAIVDEARVFCALDADSTLPMTIYHGTLDDDVPIDSSRRIAASYPLCELVEIEGAGHVIATPGDLDMEDEVSWRYVTSVIDSISQRIRLALARSSPSNDQ